MSLKYDSGTPCTTCPFGRGPDSLRHFRPERVREVCEATSFTCHKTTRETGDGTERECAGFMAFKLETEGPTQMMRIAGRIGMLSDDVIEQLESEVDTGGVFTDVDEMIEAHEEGTR